jgi:hypothetical protein
LEQSFLYRAGRSFPSVIEVTAKCEGLLAAHGRPGTGEKMEKRMSDFNAITEFIAGLSYGLNKYQRSFAFCVLLAIAAAIGLRPALAAQGVEIKTLSSRPDMVSGGDVLVQVTGPPEILAKNLAIWASGREVTSAFHVSPLTQTLVGLVGGLAPGKTLLVVKTGRKVRARLEITNHAVSGPIISGPHQMPFVCETDSAGLGPPLDPDCSVKTQVAYFYKTAQPPSLAEMTAKRKPGDPPSGFKVYDANAPRPSDLAQATTTEGKKVDYIVRRETGTINRAVYEIAFLHVPGTPLPDPWTATPSWNRRLVYTFGGGCSAGYRQGHPPNSLDNMMLSLGYAQATSSLNVFGNNCDDVISAETLAMVKEHFIKSFGVPVHTIGWGGSGGSMQQHLISQNYPELLDGIIPSMSYPDIVTVVPGIVDCTLLAHALDNSKLAWTEEQKTAISGFATWGTCSKESKGNSWIKTHFSPDLAHPMTCNRIIPHELVYDPATNLKGARCDVYDNQVNVFGADPKTGFARRPLDNVGVQYGLVAFNQGIISAEQFLELNQNMGGYNDQGSISAGRMEGDAEALRIAYATGQVNSGAGGLALVPIIDIRVYADTVPDIHDEYRSFVTRARLAATNGSSDNQVMMTFPFTTKPDKKLGESFAGVAGTLVPKMDQWLDNLAKQPSKVATLAAIVAARPADLADACWSEGGEKIIEKRTYDGQTRCNQLYPPRGDPRIAAGEPLTEDVLKCTLKPPDRKDYAHPLSDQQWARLKTIFPLGVCDYTRPGIGQGPMQGTWRKY